MKRTKQINRSRIMREIWMNRNISRSQIAKTLGLDKSTISNNINELLELGIIIETAEGSAGPAGGRKPIIIKMNKGYGCVLGIELRGESYSAVAVDLDGEILYSRFEKMEITNGNIVDKFIGITQNLRKELDAKGIKLLGIGLGISGIINSREGVIDYSIPFKIEENFYFSKLVAPQIDVPVFIDNDANACVWGELAFHRRKELRDCLFLLLEFKDSASRLSCPSADCISVGIGLVINGNVHYGHDNSAGEFRSVFRAEDSLGQFSLTADEQSLVQKDENIRIKFLKELGANISLLVNTFNLTHVILGGQFERFGHEFADVLKDSINNNWPYTYRYKSETKIWFSSFGDNAVSYGAAGMVLNKLFSDLEILEEYTGHLDVQSTAGII